MATIVQQTNGEKTIYTADEYTLVQKSLTSLQNQINGLPTTDTVNGLSEQLADIMHINPMSNKYGAKGDGSTDDTSALQSAINDLPNGGTFVLPSGTFRLSSIDLTAKQNCTFYFYGTLKLLDNITPVYGAVKVGGNGNTFYNLSIDGNSSGVIDPQAFGVTSNLLLTNTSQNMHFYNLSLTNSVMSACIFDGKAYNVTFDGFTVKNVGEHAFYTSGGISHSIYWKNGTVDSVNINPYCTTASHESYFVKSRGDTLGNNYDFFFENIVQTQTTPAQVSVHFLDFAYADNFYVKKVKLGTNVNFLVTYTNGNKITVDDLTNSGGQLIWTSGSTTVDMTIKNSTINGGQTNFNIIRLFENCDIDLNNTWDTIDTTSYTIQKVTFSKCRIKPDGAIIRFDHIVDHITFENCQITSIAPSTVSNSFFLMGVTLVNANKYIRFINCIGLFNNYSHAISLYGNTNLVLANCFFDKDISAASGATPNSISLDTVDTTSFNLACQYSNGIATKNFFRGVKYNNVDYSKKKYQITVASGTTASPTTNYQYDLCRFPVMSDIQVTPQGNLNGITSYWPVLDTTNHLISVACNPAPSANVTFNVLVDVTTQ